MAEPLTVRKLLEQRGEEFDLRLVAGEGGLERLIQLPELNRPSLALAGFTDFFSWDRIQIVGVTELRYLECLTPEIVLERVSKMFEFDIPCVIVTTDPEVPDYCIEAANQHGVPLLTTKLNTSRLYGVLSPFLDLHFAPTLRVHGDLVDVYGMGVLITGRSGVGKSEAALELVERGHRLIADDVVIIKRPSPQNLIGFSNDMLRHHIEVRGLGVMDVQTLFGIGAVRPKAAIDLVIRLERWEEDKIYERLGLDIRYTEILGTRVPEYILPVKPGRNLATLAEVAALNQRLCNANQSPAMLFQERLLQRMRKNPPEGVSRPQPSPPPPPPHASDPLLNLRDNDPAELPTEMMEAIDEPSPNEIPGVLNPEDRPGSDEEHPAHEEEAAHRDR